MKVGKNTSAPIANGTTKPAASGPSASPAHGVGEPFKKPSATPARMPNTNLVAETIATHTGAEPLGKNTDFGKGATAPDGVKAEGDFNPSTSGGPRS
jgi:hypothetical protein